MFHARKKVKSIPRLLIGTSGFSYPHWKGVFYPPHLPSKQWFSFYQKHFNSVEINLTFYRSPSPNLLKRWYEQSPQGFFFTLKASRVITHLRRLRNCQREMRIMLKQFAELGEKLACILFQLPPGLKKDLKLLKKFLLTLPISPQTGRAKLSREATPLIAFEFRHHSWYALPVFELLTQKGATVVIHDMPRRGEWKAMQQKGEAKILPLRSQINFDFRALPFQYYRFHGNTGKQAWGKYSTQKLQRWAKAIKKFNRNKIKFIYFNNDANGYAVADALKIAHLLNTPSRAVKRPLAKNNIVV